MTAESRRWIAVAVAVGAITLSGCTRPTAGPPTANTSSATPSPASPVAAGPPARPVAVAPPKSPVISIREEHSGKKPAAPAASPPNDPPGPPQAKDWYVPMQADFRPEYDRDAVNRPRESWDEYWSWVGQFYDGGFFAKGWTKQSEDLLDGVHAEKTRDELRAALNALGRRAAAEWSKDNGVRKLDTNDLRVFGRRLQQAKSDDDGSGSSLRPAIAAVAAEVETKIGRP